MTRKWVSGGFLRGFSVLSVSCGVALACSSDEDDNGIDGSVAGRGPSPSAGAGGLGATSSTAGFGSGVAGFGSGVAGTSSGGSSPGAACRGLPFEGQGGEGGDAPACTGASNEAEAVPVDLFIMMDRSSSMTELVDGSTTVTRWDAIREAVQAFVESPNIGDVRLGIGFFGQSGGRDDAIDCDVARYAEPAVPIGEVADVGTDIVAAIADTLPGGLTPTIPALEGALEYAKEWAADNVGRATAVVLVTDGFPTQCGNQVSAIADVAAAARENAPFIRTFVIGVAAEFNLNSIAQSGGTDTAFIVDETDVAESFTDALLNISASPLACEYEIPPPEDAGMLVDPERVQIVYTPAVGDAEEVPRISGLGACGVNPNGGWYYNDPAAPSRILVCPCTCQRFAAGRVDIRVGCRPRVGLR